MKKRISLVEIFKALSSDSRLGMVYALHEEGSLTYTELAHSGGMHCTKDSGRFASHIRTLCNAGLIQLENKKYLLTDLGTTACDYLIELNQPPKV